ncbi:hypothetical protein [Mesorhizobium sp. RMAD-H1]|uniref:hypothetical protein n=1 Tax=Mesorhizobium sp. RMAD-H1 TaxID=2587065 RepID=UPI0016228FA8|nr:hypothetical protein [Mesorhizobium sp. RMAD-H1]
MALSTMKSETIAKVAPINQAVNVYVSFKSDDRYEDKVTFSTIYDQPQYEGGPYVTYPGGGNVGTLNDVYSGLAQGTLNVPEGLMGFITIKVLRKAVKSGVSDDTTTIGPIEFIPYDFLGDDAGNYGSGVLSYPLASKTVLTPGDLSQVSVTLTFNNPDPDLPPVPIEGAEVHFRVVTGLVPGAWAYPTNSVGTQMDYPGKAYWTTTTNAQGVATAFIQSGLVPDPVTGDPTDQILSGMVRLQITTLGGSIDDRYITLYYPSMSDDDQTPVVSSSLVIDSTYNLQGSSVVVLGMPDDMPDKYKGANVRGFVYLETDSGKNGVISEIEIMKRVVDNTYLSPSAANFERNDGGNNTPVIWYVDSFGTAAKSQKTSTQVFGEYSNRPDITLPNNNWIDPPYPAKRPGKNQGAITPATLADNGNRMRVQIDDPLPDEYLDGTYQLYYILFANSGEDGKLGEALYYYPDYTTGAPGLPLQAGTNGFNQYRSIMLDGNKFMGYAPPGQFYCVCAVTQDNTSDPSTWTYCNYVFAKKDTWWTLDTA